MQIVQQQFDGKQLRAIERDGQPWFVLVDVCAALEIKQPASLAGRLEDDEKGVVSINTPGGPQNMMVINESGLYAAILKCKKPQAHAFRKWITNEVLPALRTKGSYTLNEVALPTPDFSGLERLAGLTVQALTVVKAEIQEQVAVDIIQARADMTTDMDAKIGSLQASSEQQHDVKRLVRHVVNGRQRLGLASAIFASVYRECWDACRIGNLPSMTRVQYPQAVAFLRAELARLAELGDSGLFPEDGKNGKQVSA